jgi:Ca-activated chloride channel family protein
MRGGKLERAVAAVEGVLSSLAHTDRFALVTFNDRVRAYPPSGQLAPGSSEKRAEARSFFRSGYLSGGTDLFRALPAAFKRLDGSSAQKREVVVITDGQPSLGQLEASTIVKAAARANESLGASRARLYIVGIGDGANHGLLERLARDGEGRYTAVGERTDIAPHLRRFLHQLDAAVVDDVQLGVDSATGIEAVYPVAAGRVTDGSTYLAVGRYKGSTKAAQFALRGALETKRLENILTGPLPRRDSRRSWIARSWSQHRVADLLERIESEGERREWVEEILTLARENLLETPYTSLMTAARSVLRPRAIPPGDPLLTVRVDRSDRAVTAIFPFGMIKALRPVEPGLFETRFLAPHHISDGRHGVDLIITGRDGSQRRVRDHFIIDGRPPRPQIEPPDGPVRAGERLSLRVRSDRDTRRLAASLRIPGRVNSRPPTELRWSDEELACVGDLIVDPDLPTGTYDLVVIAEDHAHNVGSATIPVDVRRR